MKPFFTPGAPYRNLITPQKQFQGHVTFPQFSSTTPPSTPKAPSLFSLFCLVVMGFLPGTARHASFQPLLAKPTYTTVECLGPITYAVDTSHGYPNVDSPKGYKMGTYGHGVTKTGLICDFFESPKGSLDSNKLHEKITVILPDSNITPGSTAYQCLLRFNNGGRDEVEIQALSTALPAEIIIHNAKKILLHVPKPEKTRAWIAHQPRQGFKKDTQALWVLVLSPEVTGLPNNLIIKCSEQKPQLKVL